MNMKDLSGTEDSTGNNGCEKNFGKAPEKTILRSLKKARAEIPLTGIAKKGKKMMEFNGTMNEEQIMNEMETALSPAVPHCPVMVVLDTSHSMWGQGMTDQQNALQAFCKSISGQEFAGAQIDIAAVSMGSNLRMLEEFTPFRQSGLASLAIRPKGDTPIGEALALALQALDKQLARYRASGISCVTPQLIILSDGESSDNFAFQAAEIARRIQSGELICRAIATGENPDMASLSKIAGNNVLRPEYGNLRETFGNVGMAVSHTYEDEAAEIFNRDAEEPKAEAGIAYLLDGSNILHWDKYRRGISLDNVLVITGDFDRRGIGYQVYFDATAPHILRQKSKEEADAYEELLKKRPDRFLQVPGGTKADDFLLAVADRNPETILISNDLYRDHSAQYPWVHDKKRVVCGMILNDMVFFPEISLKIPWNPPEKNGNGSL